MSDGKLSDADLISLIEGARAIRNKSNDLYDDFRLLYYYYALIRGVDKDWIKKTYEEDFKNRFKRASKEWIDALKGTSRKAELLIDMIKDMASKLQITIE